MKKIISLLFEVVFVLTIVTTFVRCQKDKLPENVNTELVNNFKSTLLNEKEKFSNEEIYYEKKFTLSFLQNPFDYQGSKHNEILSKINTHNLDSVIIFISTNYGVKFNHTSEEYVYSTSNLLSHIYDENYNYNTDFINSLDELSYTEKSIVNCYFSIIDNIDNLYLRVKLSKVAEMFVITSNLDFIVKQRLLTVFAIYRYSTYYWETTKSNQIADIADAMAYYLALNGDWEEGFIEDGKDVYAFSSLISWIAYPYPF